MASEEIVIIASGILRDTRGYVLLLRRNASNKSFKGCWQLPEGKIEFGESPQQALKREIKEELGLNVLQQHLLLMDTSSFSITDKKYYLLRIVFEVRYSGDISLDNEHDKHEWFDISNLPPELKFVEGTKEVLEKVI